MKYNHPKEDEYSYLGHQHVKDYGKRDSKYDRIHESGYYHAAIFGGKIMLGKNPLKKKSRKRDGTIWISTSPNGS